MAFMANQSIVSSWAVGSAGGNREDLLDIITNVSPTDTPFLSSFGKSVSKGIAHDWLLDTLVTFGDPENGNTDVQATPESYDASFTLPVNPVRLSNNTHIIRVTLDVSETQRVVNSAGRADDFVYHLGKKTKELARYIEFALVHSQKADQATVGNAQGSPLTARKMDGVMPMLDPDPCNFVGLDAAYEATVTDPTGSPYTRLTEAIYNGHLADCWTKGADVSHTYANSVQKREISGFGDGIRRRSIALDEKRLINAIDVYESDFGMQIVVLHRYLSQRVVVTLERDLWFTAFLRPTKFTPLAKVGNSDKAMIEGELTLECRAPAGNGYIKNLSNTYGSVA